MYSHLCKYAFAPSPPPSVWTQWLYSHTPGANTSKYFWGIIISVQIHVAHVFARGRTQETIPGISCPIITLHVFVCDLENYMEKLSWNYFSWKISCQLHQTMFRKILAPIKIKSALPPQNKPNPPPNEEFYGHGISCRKNACFQAPIKLAQQFLAPELRANNFTDTRLFSTCFRNYFRSNFRLKCILIRSAPLPRGSPNNITMFCALWVTGSAKCGFLVSVQGCELKLGQTLFGQKSPQGRSPFKIMNIRTEKTVPVRRVSFRKGGKLLHWIFGIFSPVDLFLFLQVFYAI